MAQDSVELYDEEHVCPSCRGDGIGVDVVEIETLARGDGWTASGSGVSYCPRCGAISRLLVERLSVELEGLPCPRCHDEVEYEITLACLSSGVGEFTFTTLTTCPGCKHESVFRRLLRGFGCIRRIKIGPTGLELELGDKAG